jgi:Kazal-type serine protease inhibitor domain
VKKFLFSFGFLFFALSSVAQIRPPCVDVNLADPFFQCNDPTFAPVCGCNQITYRNECAAFRNGGVTLIAYNGVCLEDVFYYRIYSNTVTAELNLYLQFTKRSPATIQIRDTYGKLMLSKNFLSIDNRQFTWYVSDYTPGMYYVYVISGGIFDIQKFMKL